MIQPPLDYIQPVFRPPSEGRSLILQVTNGCSWNKCTFCEMYTAQQKKFAPKAEDKVIEEIKRCGEQLTQVRRVFLGDGDAMVLSTRRLKTILEAIQQYLPSVSRVSAYCLARNIKNKTEEELRELRELGLSLIYIGAESGDDEVLEKINKGETFASTKNSILKAKAAGIKVSVMVINGMGGRGIPDNTQLTRQNLLMKPSRITSRLLYSFSVVNEIKWSKVLMAISAP